MFCKWNEPAGTSAAANPCHTFTDVAGCNSMVNGECSWEKKNTDPTTVQPKPLFSTDFCHPVIVNKDTAETMWTLCTDAKDTTECSIATGCNWSDGKELIPDHDFCAPMDIT